ncbi:hypothetical protein [Legionella antarctica]|nr:hypothetical protein [Legionella antarctica]
MMQINNLLNPEQNISNLSNKSEKLSKNQPSATPIETTAKQTINQYDVHHMTPNELEELITELRESGQISEKESMMLTIDRFSILSSGGVSKDTKIDMTAFFEEQIDIMKTNPGTKGVEYLERSLDILRAVEARHGSDIPRSV